MTATPIPRTVAMTVFGDLDVSTLTELPAGRSPITTHVVPAGEKPHFLERAWERVREEVAAGHQVYVVCPRIGGDDPDSGTDGFEAAVDRPAPAADDEWALWDPDDESAAATRAGPSDGRGPGPGAGARRRTAGRAAAGGAARADGRRTPRTT